MRTVTVSTELAAQAGLALFLCFPRPLSEYFGLDVYAAPFVKERI